ncbi:hypothetical protein [Agromyces archimandritae]|uniref:NIPSNAP family containing protein n=1 Tax=Agromyces archimandritae TaxID=2781962 RepID=A0A975FND5_9MICO|nr:hypothetical protein [Agromyces archimandritae]QTX05365.1 hypothetical protein G127AT_03820 [Agromyces archimandritae]
MKTVQLRRYVINEGLYERFVEWWHEWMPKVRPKMGFAIEFAYSIPETREFVWAVSAPGDAEAFRALEETYMTSPERAAAFEGQPVWVESVDIRLVDVQAG